MEDGVSGRPGDLSGLDEHLVQESALRLSPWMGRPTTAVEEIARPASTCGRRRGWPWRRWRQSNSRW